MFEYKFTVVKVVDGDTIDALVDLGFSVHKKIRVRLYGINTPESRPRDLEEKKRGLEAKDRLESLLKEHKETLFIKSHGTGKFGRCLGELLFKEYDEFQDEFVVKNINRQLDNEGHAVEYFGVKR